MMGPVLVGPALEWETRLSTLVLAFCVPLLAKGHPAHARSRRKRPPGAARRALPQDDPRQAVGGKGAALPPAGAAYAAVRLAVAVTVVVQQWRDAARDVAAAAGRGAGCSAAGAAAWVRAASRRVAAVVLV